MCGRFAVTTNPARLAEQLGAVDETGSNFAPNYNVAPTTDIAAVIATGADGHDDGRRHIRLMRWGLLPGWVKADADGRPVQKAQLINARAETVTTSPAYRSAAEHKRCLVPMDGYYEWKRPVDALPGKGARRGPKTPYFFSRPDHRPLLVAGLWSVWRPARDAPGLLTCTVITTDAVGAFADVHDRMPLVLDEDDWGRWLNPELPAPQDVLRSPPAVSDMAMREVSTLVNRVANNGPELLGPPHPLC